MNFFGVGPLELALIIIVAVIFLGPERIPEAAVQVARAIKFLRGYATDTTSQLRRELEELTREYEDVRRELTDFRRAVRSDIEAAAGAIQKHVLDEPIIEASGEPPPRRDGK
jgi:sec-independent protein translocase protein TatB